MKKFFTTTVAACLCSTAATAGPLSDQEAALVIAAVGSMRVTTECTGYEGIENSWLTLGDKMGVDSERLADAIQQALAVSANMQYDRSKLIPEVTRLFRQTYDSMTDEQDKDKAKFCARWGEALIKMGVIKRKQP